MSFQLFLLPRIGDAHGALSPFHDCFAVDARLLPQSHELFESGAEYIFHAHDLQVFLLHLGAFLIELT